MRLAISTWAPFTSSIVYPLEGEPSTLDEKQARALWDDHERRNVYLTELRADSDLADARFDSAERAVHEEERQAVEECRPVNPEVFTEFHAAVRGCFPLGPPPANQETWDNRIRHALERRDQARDEIQRFCAERGPKLAARYEEECESVARAWAETDSLSERARIEKRHRQLHSHLTVLLGYTEPFESGDLSTFFDSSPYPPAEAWERYEAHRNPTRADPTDVPADRFPVVAG